MFFTFFIIAREIHDISIGYIAAFSVIPEDQSLNTFLSIF